MASVARGLVPVTGDAWRDDNTTARAVTETPSTAGDVVTEALIRRSDGVALTTTTERAVRERRRAELGGRGW